MAEKYFNDALVMIKTSSTDDDKISKQAEILLDSAIENALIIEKEFYETKYLDDAYYILGMSSYYKNRITASNYYFPKLLEQFPNTDYFNKTNIWLAYIDLKIGELVRCHLRMNEIESKNLTKYEFLLFYKLILDKMNYYDPIHSIYH